MANTQFGLIGPNWIFLKKFDIKKIIKMRNFLYYFLAKIWIFVEGEKSKLGKQIKEPEESVAIALVELLSVAGWVVREKNGWQKGILEKIKSLG